ncbi:S9 family peptidase [Kordiimonas pumila]|uniref:Prolyl oligopeptidase family serine peptidase n=1 Tax=Kordiimonas pumila TaxID=2161677 RepID=A0ABV7D6P7_9PROT|nr:S9 family peptidase [Kordiimonas pumila]
MFRCIAIMASLSLVFFSCSGWAKDAALNPADMQVEVFAALPNFENPKLSPDGTKMAFFTEDEGRRNLVIYSLTGEKPILIPPQDKVDYGAVFWKSDNVLLIRFDLSLNRWIFRGNSDESRMVSLNLEEMDFKWLGRPKRSRSDERVSQYDSMIDLLPDDPDHILLSLDHELDGYPTVYRVDVLDGGRRTAQSGRTGINRWYSDNAGEVRLGKGYRVQSTELNMKYKTVEGDWLDLNDLEWTNHYTFAGFTADNDNTAYVYGLSEKGTTGIYKLDMLSGKILSSVFTMKNHDIDYLYYHPVTNRLAGVFYTDDYTKLYYFDEDLDLLQRSIDHVLPGTINRIVSKARNRELYLILVRSDQNPGDYYFYDREKKSLGYFVSKRTAINEAIMATTKPVIIPVRDGSTIPGYVTLPHGKEAKNLPTIILPHGGPSARDSAEWDYEAQFYASRGWLVLKPNFRGSEGYGPAFEHAGDLQWGGLMQDDVTDATKWLVAEGVADPDRICIVGSSYGGYAALFATIKEPGLYKCAVSVNGVADLVRLKSGDKHYIGGRSWVKDMGLEGVDDKEVSPYHRAEDISAPVLLVAAKDDARVPYDLSRDLYSRLKRLKKPVDYVELKNGTHHMVTAEARFETLKAAEKFLKQYLD